jgi:hypothetical protein
MILNIDKGLVKLNGKSLPGILHSISIGSEVIFDEANVTGTSGTKKQAKGWSDSAISIDMFIIDNQDNDGNITESRYDILSILDGLFKKVQSGKPVVYSVNHPHFKARNIKHMLFSNLDSSEDTKGISCALKFVEYDPPVAIVQERNNNVEEKKEEDKSYEIKEDDVIAKNEIVEINKLHSWTGV